MEQEILYHILDIQDRAMADEEYRKLSAVFHQLNDRLLEVIFTLPETEQDLLWNYIATGAEMHRRLLELALECKL